MNKRSNQYNYLRRLIQLMYIMRSATRQSKAIRLTDLQLKMAERKLSESKYTHLTSRGKKEGYILEYQNRLYLSQKAIEVLEEVKKQRTARSR